MVRDRQAAQVQHKLQPRGKKPRRGAEAILLVTRRAEALGLIGHLGQHIGLHQPGGGGAFAAFLSDQVRKSSIEAWDVPRIGTMLTWVEAFVVATQRYILFKPSFLESEKINILYNRATLDMVGQFIHMSPPLAKSKGPHVASEGVAGLVSCLHTLRSREARYDIAPAEYNIVMPLALKRYRLIDGPKGDRKRSMGLRLDDFMKAVQAGFQRATLQAIIDWAAALAAHSLLLRGGELGIPDGVVMVIERILTWQSLKWQSPRSESLNRLWLFALVVPIKDTNANAKVWPCPIGRRHDGAFGADPVCTYDAIALAWWSRRATRGQPFPIDGQGKPLDRWWETASEAFDAPDMDEPFFTQPGNMIYNTSYAAKVFKSIARAAGLNDEEVGGKAGRIGGSIDWRQQLGEDGASRVMKQRGRWHSDVSEVYQRPLLTSHLAPSMMIGSNHGASIEDLCADFAQSAWS